MFRPASFRTERSRAFAFFFTFLFLFSFALTGCSQVPKKKLEIFALDTYVTITLEGKDVQEAMTKCTDILADMEGKLSRQRADSEISALNRSSEESPVVLSDETYSLLSQVYGYSEKTQGAFDMTIAPLMDLWGFGKYGEHVPEQSAIDETLLRVDYRKVHLLSGNRAYVEPGTEVDLGGAAKGYIGDILMEKLKEYDLRKIILDLGGNVCAWSSSSELNIGIADPGEPGKIFCTYEMKKGERLSVITSGSYERFFEENGVRYGHIMDTSTGCPAVTDLLSVTVVGTDGTRGDVYSTTLYAIGSKEAMKLASEENIDCILCLDNGTLWVSSSLKGKVHAQEGRTIEYFS